MNIQLTIPNISSTPLPRKKKDTLRLTAREADVVQALGEYYYLTPAQVTRLFWSVSSRRKGFEVLRSLKEKGYVDTYRFFNAPNAPMIATLSTKGRNFLATQDEKIRARYRKSEVQEQSDDFYYHLTTINDALISAGQIHREVPSIELAEWLHDYDLRLDPVYVTLPNGKERYVVPDAFLEFHCQQNGMVVQQCIVLEVDRKPSKGIRWNNKARALVTYAETAYPKKFGTTSFTCGFIATQSAAHAASVLRRLSRAFSQAPAQAFGGHWPRGQRLGWR